MPPISGSPVLDRKGVQVAGGEGLSAEEDFSSSGGKQSPGADSLGRDAVYVEDGAMMGGAGDVPYPPQGPPPHTLSQSHQTPAPPPLAVLGADGTVYYAYVLPQGAGFAPQGAGFAPPGSGFSVQAAGFTSQGTVFPLQGAGYPPQGARFPLQGAVIPIYGVGVGEVGQGVVASSGRQSGGSDRDSVRFIECAASRAQPAPLTHSGVTASAHTVHAVPSGEAALMSQTQYCSSSNTQIATLPLGMVRQGGFNHQMLAPTVFPTNSADPQGRYVPLPGQWLVGGPVPPCAVSTQGHRLSTGQAQYDQTQPVLYTQSQPAAQYQHAQPSQTYQQSVSYVAPKTLEPCAHTMPFDAPHVPSSATMPCSASQVPYGISQTHCGVAVPYGAQVSCSVQGPRGCGAPNNAPMPLVVPYNATHYSSVASSQCGDTGCFGQGGGPTACGPQGVLRALLSTGLPSAGLQGRFNPLINSANMDVIWHGVFDHLFAQFGEDRWTLSPSTCDLSHTSLTPFNDSAKVRFLCHKCCNAWTSMKGRVIFWFRLDSAAHRGEVHFQLFGQKCQKCMPKEFESAMWYPEEVVKVLTNVQRSVAGTLYGCAPAPVLAVRRKGKPRTQHNASLCQACASGICREQTNNP